MPFRYRWTYVLEVGFGAIDEQHKELFKRANDFFDALNAGREKAALQQTLAFLSEYVHQHFEDEEGYMKRHRYPRFDEHRAGHRKFTVDYEEIVHSLESEEPLVVSVRLQQRLSQWLAYHVNEEDRNLAAFLREKTLKP